MLSSEEIQQISTLLQSVVRKEIAEVEGRLGERINELSRNVTSVESNLSNQVTKVLDHITEISMAHSEDSEVLSHRVDLIEKHFNLSKPQ